MKTVIVGATPNPSRYALLAAGMLKEYGFEFVPLGIKSGVVHGEPIIDLRKRPEMDDVDTITLYIGARHQPEWYDYLISLNPRRVIFNPGTENAEFESLLNQHGIEPVEACTLVLLRTGQY
jgi:hypothetical protein